jgi:hypothetical protein
MGVFMTVPSRKHPSVAGDAELKNVAVYVR